MKNLKRREFISTAIAGMGTSLLVSGLLQAKDEHGMMNQLPLSQQKKVIVAGGGISV